MPTNNQDNELRNYYIVFFRFAFNSTCHGTLQYAIKFCKQQK